MIATLPASNAAGPLTDHKWSYLPTAELAVLLEVTRGDLVESAHLGAMAVVGADGRLLASVGDPWVTTFLRSAAKPLQVLPLIESGAYEHFGFDEHELAVMCASHSGEPEHEAAVQSILDKIGLSPEHLKCGTHTPFSKEAARLLREKGEKPRVLQCNCSGKHAGMLALAVQHGWPTDGYYKPGHPVQRMMRQAVAEVCGLEAEQVRTGTDGCTVVTFAMPLYHMAWGFARLVQPQQAGFSPERQAAANLVVSAMRGHAAMVGGETRPPRIDTDLLRVGQTGQGGRQMVAKVGAEGLQCLGLLPVAAEMGDGPLPGGGVGVAMKVADGDKLHDSEGNYRARDQVTIEILRQLRAVDELTWINLREKYAILIKNNRGEIVGSVRPSFRLLPSPRPTPQPGSGEKDKVLFVDEQTKATVRDRIEMQLRSMEVALRSGDLLGVAGFYDDNAIISDFKRVRVVGRAAIDAHWQGMAGLGMSDWKLEMFELDGTLEMPYHIGRQQLPARWKARITPPSPPSC